MLNQFQNQSQMHIQQPSENEKLLLKEKLKQFTEKFEFITSTTSKVEKLKESQPPIVPVSKGVVWQNYSFSQRLSSLTNLKLKNGHYYDTKGEIPQKYIISLSVDLPEQTSPNIAIYPYDSGKKAWVKDKDLSLKLSAGILTVLLLEQWIEDINLEDIDWRPKSPDLTL